MIEMHLTSQAELIAEKAEKLAAFSGLKLLHIKSQLTKILAQIGNNGIFDEYTKHDISHIDAMLNSLDDIIPENTKHLLTQSDWLMIVLSIYFHDLGMLVTKDEFDRRDQSTAYIKFKKDILDGNFGQDYKTKILSLKPSDKQDRFIYQELVRKTHAERIKYWIMNENNLSFQTANKISDEIRKLLDPLDSMFRRDLAFICESHHLEDLDNFDKYDTCRSYGNSKDSDVNLHYAALILRTADLLHITSDRTPNIEYNLINPTDPVSQEEWAKQRSVKSVRPQKKRNSEGNIDLSLEKDTFEVTALFQEDKGFFGLVAYLDYAAKELKRNHEYNELAKKVHGVKYEYPWKNIDDSKIEAKDFEKKQFEFTLDQTKILDLLVGHTLYNDSAVVLRELTQNGIDAVKLKRYELENARSTNLYDPEVLIDWNKEDRVLQFKDNGTGMTLEIIQNHLLKVGSSRYQDLNFKKKYPDFSPISRFGIGLLTCFLIADDIDIITKSEENDKVILLRIKKVHGKYLLKYFDPSKTEDLLGSHGTTIKLSVRSDIDLSNIEYQLKKWIIIPNCKVTLLDNGKVIKIGHPSPKDTLTHYMEEQGYKINGKDYKIAEIEKNGLTLAVALRYVEHFKEWTFIQSGKLLNDSVPYIGTCVEGIKVKFITPGFEGIKYIALANTTGKNSPKTNVARSNIEADSENDLFLSKIYSLYLSQIEIQLKSLMDSGFSLSWSTSEINYLLSSFIDSNHTNSDVIDLISEDAFEKALNDFKFILIEDHNKREVISPNELLSKGYYWTIDSSSYTSANDLIKELKGSSSSSLALMRSIFGENESKTDKIDYLLCPTNYSSIIEHYVTYKYQVTTIEIVPEQRRIDLKWSISEKNLWEKFNIEGNYTRTSTNVFIQIEDVEIDTQIDQTVINSKSGLFLLKNSEINIYLNSIINKTDRSNTKQMELLYFIISVVEFAFQFKKLDRPSLEKFINDRITRRDYRYHAVSSNKNYDKEELIEAIINTNFNKYDITIWDKRYPY